MEGGIPNWPYDTATYKNALLYYIGNDAFEYNYNRIDAVTPKFQWQEYNFENYYENGQASEMYLEIFFVPIGHPAFPGRGVRAKRNIPEHTCIGFYGGDYRVDGMCEEDHKGSSYIFKTEGKNMIIDGARTSNIIRCVNDPNGTRYKDNIKAYDKNLGNGLWTVGFFTTKAIKKGKELFYSYGDFFDNSKDEKKAQIFVGPTNMTLPSFSENRKFEFALESSRYRIGILTDDNFAIALDLPEKIVTKSRVIFALSKKKNFRMLGPVPQFPISFPIGPFLNVSVFVDRKIVIFEANGNFEAFPIDINKSYEPYITILEPDKKVLLK